jgi:adenylylsulfate kinase
MSDVPQSDPNHSDPNHSDANHSDAPQIVWHHSSVQTNERNRRLGQRGCVVWFTGLSGSGKSTIANAVDRKLFELGAVSYLLDGDNVRHGLCATPQLLESLHGPSFARRFGLGFGPEDREENIRRVGAVTELFASAGLICLTAFVSPYRRDRDRVRTSMCRTTEIPFLEVFVNTPLEICIQRDPKGLYRKAMAGEIPNFTGISDPYEPPTSPELELLTPESSVDSLADQVIDYLASRHLITP